MAAGLYDIIIEQGADWRLAAEWRDKHDDAVNLSGCTARMQIRENYSAKGAVLELSTDNGLITLEGASGIFRVRVPATMTEGLRAPATKLTWMDGKLIWRLVYDLEIVDDQGAVTRLMQGACLFVPEVTR
ncbi:hypothetical protein IAI58_19270 (plasmid) [Roseomonas marmotae]|uniref:hypothetical protein n=1 Tax=Roseomonas marmotae TaxID=2768161 RepID=UPI001AD69024|nr:hypothetical protein [Roseomonas marmotae]QTI81484.1 hypothetical protein IAI58_19270 [Roseomonas marmotae]